jgi:hypothetical protein
MQIHSTITRELVIAACERRMTTLDDPGFCLECGAELQGVDPDAEAGECELCGEDAVSGCETLLFEMVA